MTTDDLTTTPVCPELEPVEDELARLYEVDNEVLPRTRAVDLIDGIQDAIEAHYRTFLAERVREYAETVKTGKRAILAFADMLDG